MSRSSVCFFYLNLNYRIVASTNTSRLTSVTQKNVPSAIVIYYCAWYVFLRDRRYQLKVTLDWRIIPISRYWLQEYTSEKLFTKNVPKGQLNSEWICILALTCLQNLHLPFIRQILSLEKISRLEFSNNKICLMNGKCFFTSEKLFTQNVPNVLNSEWICILALTCLQNLYLPFIGQILSLEKISRLESKDSKRFLVLSILTLLNWSHFCVKTN